MTSKIFLCKYSFWNLCQHNFYNYKKFFKNNKNRKKVPDQGANNHFPNETGEVEMVGQVRN